MFKQLLIKALEKINPIFENTSIYCNCKKFFIIKTFKFTFKFYSKLGWRKPHSKTTEHQRLGSSAYHRVSVSHSLIGWRQQQCCRICGRQRLFVDVHVIWSHVVRRGGVGVSWRPRVHRVALCVVAPAEREEKIEHYRTQTHMELVRGGGYKCGVIQKGPPAKSLSFRNDLR